MKDVLAVVLAGGKGSRLEPLTRDRAKPAVPFGGIYRIIDFSLSNCLNSGFRQIYVLTQYKAMSLDRHIDRAWRHLFSRELGEFVDTIPPQQRIDENWYQGTADAVYQNIYVFEQVHPTYVVVLAGDHIYKMNYRAMLDYHIEAGADLTIGALQVDRESAKQFGVMTVDSNDRVVEFHEKPDQPATVPGKSDVCLASMGIYVFNTRFLFEQLCRDANDRSSAHDFGQNIIPSIIDEHRVFAYSFHDENRKTQNYWKDVGTLDAYYDANMDLISIDPQLNLYDRHWPVRTFQPNCPPPKFVHGGGNDRERIGRAIDSVICQGSIVSGGLVDRSIVGPFSRINSYARVVDSILFDGVTVGRGAQIQRAIIDKGVSIPPDVQIGFDADADRQRGFAVSEGGVVVIGKGDKIDAPVSQPADVTV